MPALWQRAFAEERTHGTRGAKGQVPGLSAHPGPGTQRPTLQPGVQRAGDERLPGSHEHPGHPTHLRGLLPNRDGLAGGKKRATSLPPRTRCCPAKKAMCWNSMNSGALWEPRRRRSGGGWRFVGAPARSWLGRSATAVNKVRRTCVRLCPQITAAAPAAATSGKPTGPPSREHASRLRQRGG